MNEGIGKKIGLRLLGGCAIYLFFFAAAWLVNDHFLQNVAPDPRRVCNGVASFFIALGIFSYWGILTGGGNSRFTREKLIARAESGTPPEDGQPILCSGSARATGSALRSPLQGKECVAYMYRMYYYGTGYGSSGNDAQMVNLYTGYASVPFSIRGMTEERRVVAVPQLKDNPSLVTDDAGRARAAEFIASTPFEPMQQRVLSGAAASLQLGKEMLTDDDGMTRHDWHLQTESLQVPLERLLLDEIVVPVGPQVTVVGTWSDARGAIIPGDGLNGAIGVSVTSGGPESVPLDIVSNRSTLSYFITATILTGVGVGVIFFARHFFVT